jgi:hypothetical protein
VNSWEQSFYAERTQKLGQSLQAQEDALQAARAAGLDSIAQAKDLQAEVGLGALKAQLGELTEALNRLLLRESKAAPAENQGPEGGPEQEPELELEPGEKDLEEVQPGEPGQDFNLAQRFSELADPQMLATELVQLIADMGKAIPAVKPVADKLLELL